MSAPPAKKLTREAGPTRGADELRSFKYFTPAKRRASLYEEVTCDTQPSIHRHMQRGWLVSFEDGRGTWDDASTAARSSDWFAFRDPGGVWERTFYQHGTEREKAIEGTLSASSMDKLFEDFDPEWVDVLREHLQALAYVENGLWLATATTARACLSDTIAHAVAFESALKQRLAQAIVLYGMDLEPHFGPMPIEPAQERFLRDELWQPVRRYLERLRTTLDWMELIVAVNVCFEPVVGVFLRRELGIRAATAAGDSVTPAVFRTGQSEWEWTRGWTAELMRFLLADAEHGAHNRELLEGWLDDWLPLAREAASALTALEDVLPGDVSLDASLARVHRDAAEFHEACGIGELIGGAA